MKNDSFASQQLTAFLETLLAPTGKCTGDWGKRPDEERIAAVLCAWSFYGLATTTRALAESGQIPPDFMEQEEPPAVVATMIDLSDRMLQAFSRSLGLTPERMMEIQKDVSQSIVTASREHLAKIQHS